MPKISTLKHSWQITSGTTPEIRRQTRSRLKTRAFEGVKYQLVVDNWDFNDHVYKEFYFEPEIKQIREKYEQERRRVEANSHPLCFRFGKAAAIKKLERLEKRELFHCLKWLRKK